MRVNNLSKVALDSAAAGIEPAISSRKSNALTTTPPSHRVRRTTGDNDEAERRCWRYLRVRNREQLARCVEARKL